MLKRLCEVAGVTGNEDAVRRLLYETVGPLADRVEKDTVGSLIAHKDGHAGDFRILIAAHMDEVGAIATSITADGYVRFAPVGEVDPRAWPGKRVAIGRSGVRGIVGIRSVHMQNAEQRLRNVKPEELYIDIGAFTQEDALARISPGDYIVFAGEYEEFGDRLIKAKALDCRAGCAIVAELLEERHQASLIAAFTAQTEVGFRGAILAANTLDYDMAIAVSLVPAGDVYGGLEVAEARLGGGPVILSGIHSGEPEGVDEESLVQIAAKAGVICQRATIPAQEYEGEKLRKPGAAVPVLAVGIPCRNPHTPAVVVHKDDLAACGKLLRLVLNDYGKLNLRRRKQ